VALYAALCGVFIGLRGVQAALARRRAPRTIITAAGAGAPCAGVAPRRGRAASDRQEMTRLFSRAAARACVEAWGVCL